MSRFLFILLLIAVCAYFLSVLFERASFRRPAGRSKDAGAGRDLVQDPNCLTYLSKEDALEAARDGVTHYFCSAECAEAFEKHRAKRQSAG